MDTAITRMTKGERSDLASLIRKREKLMKTTAGQRAAELMADFEAQISKLHSFDDDAVWEEATKIAQNAVIEANKVIDARCAELGIPDEFQPRLSFPHWLDRGGNAVAQRRTELRRLAKTKIDAAEKQARIKIEHYSLEAQTELISTGLISDASKKFLEDMPTVETLMPTLDAVQIKGLLPNTNQRKESQ